MGSSLLATSWTDVVTALGTAGLFLVAAMAAVFGYLQFRFLDATERRKVTFALIRDYTATIFIKDYASATDALISPMQAYTNLALGSTKPALFPVIRPGEPIRIRDTVAEMASNYLVLRNYLAEVDDLYTRKMVDRDLLLSRLEHVILTAVATLRRFADLVAGSADDEVLLARLEGTASDFGARRVKRQGGG